MTKTIVEALVIIIPLLPILLKFYILLDQLGRNKKITNLSERAEIIVAALEGSDISNPEKKNTALLKLEQYALEAGINMTPGQIDDYIQSAYEFLKLLKNTEVKQNEQIH